MIRTALASLLLALALPAQWLGPSDIYLHGKTRAEPVMLEGKLYLMLWHTNEGIRWEHYAPGRPLQTRLIARAVYAFDSRPCAQLRTCEGCATSIVCNDDPWPLHGWTLDATATLLGARSGLVSEARRPSEPNPYHLHYGKFTPCTGRTAPDVFAVLFEVQIL